MVFARLATSSARMTRFFVAAAAARVNFAQPSQHGLSARFTQLRLERFAPAGLRDRCERPACNETVNIQSPYRPQ